MLWNSKSSMIANQEKLDSMSNNLANVGTDGYKRVEVNFKDLMYETLERNGYPISNNGDRSNAPFTGTGVKTSEWIRDSRQGNLYETKKSTDFAIDGDGYFQITRANGEVAYTRSGKFEVDADGRLVDPNGNILNINFNENFSSENVKFTKDNFSVSDTGVIFANVNNEIVNVGKISLYNSLGSNSMMSIGDNLYIPSQDAEIYEVQNSNILQGLVEGSNVDMVTEMTELLVTQRAFELGSRGIKTADEMWGMANNLRGK